MAASVIKSGVVGVRGGEQTEALADAGVELGLSVHRGGWPEARPSNGRAED